MLGYGTEIGITPGRIYPEQVFPNRCANFTYRPDVTLSMEHPGWKPYPSRVDDNFPVQRHPGRTRVQPLRPGYRGSRRNGATGAAQDNSTRCAREGRSAKTCTPPNGDAS